MWGGGWCKIITKHSARSGIGGGGWQTPPGRGVKPASSWEQAKSFFPVTRPFKPRPIKRPVKNPEIFADGGKMVKLKVAKHPAMNYVISRTSFGSKKI